MRRDGALLGLMIEVVPDTAICPEALKTQTGFRVASAAALQFRHSLQLANQPFVFEISCEAEL